MTTQEIENRASYLYYCREAYREGVRPLDTTKSDNPNFRALVEIAQVYKAENAVERFSHYMMEGHYFVQLWTAHLILAYFNPDEQLKDRCIEEIKKYSTSPLNPEVAEQEREWLRRFYG